MKSIFTFILAIFITFPFISNIAEIRNENISLNQNVKKNLGFNVNSKLNSRTAISSFSSGKLKAPRKKTSEPISPIEIISPYSETNLFFSPENTIPVYDSSYFAIPYKLIINYKQTLNFEASFAEGLDMFFSLYTDSTYSELTTLGFNYYTFEPGVYF